MFPEGPCAKNDQRIKSLPRICMQHFPRLPPPISKECSPLGRQGQGTNGPGLIGRLGRPIRVTFRDKIESLLRGQGILSL
jgi:hypothetical protein